MIPNGCAASPPWASVRPRAGEARSGARPGLERGARLLSASSRPANQLAWPAQPADQQAAGSRPGGGHRVLHHRGPQPAAGRKAAGVRRIVVVSIIGTDRSTAGYGAAKLAHERAMRSGPIPVRILRAAQFHEFVAQLLEWGRQGEVSYLPKMRTHWSPRAPSPRRSPAGHRPRTGGRSRGADPGDRGPAGGKPRRRGDAARGPAR